MRVAIDGRKCLDSGIGTYVRNLVAALAELADGEARLGVLLHPGTAWEPPPSVEPIPVSQPVLSPAERIEIPGALRTWDADLYHSTHYSLCGGIAAPCVLTLHDDIPLRFPADYRFFQARWLRHMIPASLRRARLVICVSHATRKLATEAYPGLAERACVIHEAAAASFRPMADARRDALLRRLGVRGPYVLMPGSRKTHKNCAAMLAAFAMVASRLPHRLVVFGMAAERFGAAFGRAVRGFRDRIRPVGVVDNDSLVALYGGADALLFVSKMEGFGLPVLEAFACGCPVLTADRGAQAEVAGGAAVLVPPETPQAIAAALESVLGDDSRREQLCRAGQRRAREFSWREAARLTWEVYRSALAS